MAMNNTGATGCAIVRFVSLAPAKEDIPGEDPADVALLSGKNKTLGIMDTDTDQRIDAKKITWSMDQIYAPFAKIDDKGKITAKKVVEKVRVEAIGTIIGSEDTSVTVTVDIFPTVTELELLDGDEMVNGKTISVDSSAEPLVLTANIHPLDAMEGVDWTVRDKKEAFAAYEIVDNVLTVTPKADAKAGAVTIKVTSTDGSKKTATVKLQFGTYAKTVTIDKSITTLTAGDKAVQLSAIAQGVQVYSEAGGRMLFSFRTQNWWVRSNTTLNWDLSTQADTIAMAAHVYPYYGDDDAKNAMQSVTWKSSAPKIAEFVEDNEGNVSLKLHKTGSVTVTATAADGSGQKMTFKLNVIKTVTELVISDQTGASGKSLNLAKLVTIEPADATNKKLTWKITKGSAYATISSSGSFKAKKVTEEKTVEVTVSSQDSGASTTFTVTITP